jgi:YD repeat-containing protein
VRPRIQAKGKAQKTAAFAFNADNRTPLTTDRAGRTTTRRAKRPGQVESFTNAAGDAVRYRAQGICDALHDSRGRVASLTWPDHVTATFTYAAAGNLTSRSYSDGLTINYVYDESGSIVSISHPCWSKLRP